MNKYIDPYDYDRYRVRQDFHKEIIFISKKYQCKISDIEIDPHHPTGEVCIFIKKIWYGYIDNEFYKMMEGLESSWDL